MKGYRFLAASIDIAVISAVYFTFVGLLSFLDVYSVVVASFVEFIFIYYLYGKNSGLGKVLFILNDSNSELSPIQSLTCYPPTFLYMAQMICSIFYPISVLVLETNGVFLVGSLYFGVGVLGVIMFICFAVGKDFWNDKFHNSIIKKEASF